jgi:phytoene synthase
VVAAAVIDGAAAATRAQAVVRRAGTSFYWAMRFLPKPKREAMFALYAYCREVDDIADEPAPEADKRARLDGWRRELDRLYAGEAPSDPVAVALVAPIARYQLPRMPFEEILRGMETDATGPVRAPTMAELDLYCARVAGAVGLQSVRIFGCHDGHADAYAQATGRALQLTNILRDLAEDAGDGRLYLAREALDKAGITAREPAAVLAHPGLGSACAILAERAGQSYREAARLRAAMAPDDARALKPAAIMTAVYRSLFDRMAARGWERATEPVVMGKAAKLGVALRCLLTGA